MQKKRQSHNNVLLGALFGLGALVPMFFVTTLFLSPTVVFTRLAPIPPAYPLPIDKTAYDRKMFLLSNDPLALSYVYATTTATTSPLYNREDATMSASIPGHPWPAKTVYPQGGALLPFNRIVAYYGNFYSRAMGALGEYDPEDMKTRLLAAANEWRLADPNTPVIPAIHYIAIVAQADGGRDGKYRARMPDDQIDKALTLADEVHGIVFLDLQVGLSDLQSEIPVYADYLKLPNVHLAIDPEFAMQTSGARPGTVIGTFDARDINYAAEYLATIVRENKLPPKVLMVHRFTQDMVTNYRDIQPLPEVQIVMDMDGWGDQAKKINTYTHIVADEPVQFTGIKLFYKNDLKPPSTALLTPEEILDLSPQPIYIQYQ